MFLNKKKKKVKQKFTKWFTTTFYVKFFSINVFKYFYAFLKQKQKKKLKIKTIALKYMGSTFKGNKVEFELLAICSNTRHNIFCQTLHKYLRKKKDRKLWGNVF